MDRTGYTVSQTQHTGIPASKGCNQEQGGTAYKGGFSNPTGARAIQKKMSV